MQDERNASQIIRKDARNCFVESLSDAFGNGRAHFAFATYDMNKPAGQRQTNNIHIYISVPELLELCRKLSCGELRYIMQQKKQNSDPKPRQLTGTSRPAAPTRKRSTLSTALPGVRPESSSVSILPVAIWLLCLEGCRFAAGMIRTAISAALLR